MAEEENKQEAEQGNPNIPEGDCRNFPSLPESSHRSLPTFPEGNCCNLPTLLAGGGYRSLPGLPPEEAPPPYPGLPEGFPQYKVPSGFGRTCMIPYSTQALSPILEHSSSTEETPAPPPSDAALCVRLPECADCSLERTDSQREPLCDYPGLPYAPYALDITTYSFHRHPGSTQGPCLPLANNPGHVANQRLQSYPPTPGQQAGYPVGMDLSLPPPPYPGPPISTQHNNPDLLHQGSALPRVEPRTGGPIQCLLTPTSNPGSLAEALGYGTPDPGGLGHSLKPPTYTSLSLFTCLCTCPLLGCVALAFSGASEEAYRKGNLARAALMGRKALCIDMLGLSIFVAVAFTYLVIMGN